jgi:hypothetical protein
MPPTPLFTQFELAQAFTLVLPDERARALAAKWWEEFAHTVDDRGRFVYHDDWGTPRPIDGPDNPPTDKPEWHTQEVIVDEALFRDWDDEQAESWLLRLGDIHLSLVALANDDSFERMRRARYMTRSAAERNRLQITRAVRAYRRSRGWPPTA